MNVAPDNETLATRFWRNVLTCGDAKALITRVDQQTSCLTWKQLAEVVYAWACFFENEQIVGEQCVASWLPNGIDWIGIDLACQTLGLVHLAIDPRDPESRMLAIAEQSGASIVIRGPKFSGAAGSSQFSSESLLERARGVAPQKPAQMLTTSGTSGRPKLVLLSHANLLSNATAKLAAAPQWSSDLRLNILPFAHAYARTCELSTWILSRSQLAIANSWDDWLEQAPRLRPTLANFVPYLAERAARELSESKQALGGNLRLLQVGGAGLGDDLWNQLNELGLPPLQGYGLTEASPVVCSNRAGEQQPGIVGPPVAGVRLRVDAEGVLWTQGPHVMLGYWNDADATALAIRDGWLCTGDFVEARAGSMRIIGRQTEQIVLSTGYKVSPSEIEARLLKHAWIEQAVVIGSNQSSVSALLWPQLAKLPAGFFTSDPPTISTLDKARFLTAIAADIAPLMDDLPSHACPRRFSFLSEPLSVEAGTLTRKGAPVRGQEGPQTTQNH